MSQPLQKQAILCLLNTEQYEAALQKALAWLDESPNNADALYATGLAYLCSEQFEKSIDNLKLAIKLIPDNAIYIANLGIAYLRCGKTETAISTLKKAISIQPNYKLAHYNLGSAYIKNHQANLAIDSFKLLTVSHPDNAEYLCALADATREAGKWLQSIKLYKQTLELDADNCRAHTNMGPLMTHLGQFDDAIKHCQRAIELEPNRTLARKNLGDCFVQIEQLNEAMEAYADAFEIDNENIELIVAIGNVWLETAEFTEAASWFHKATQLDSDNISAQCGMAHIERELGELQSSLNRLQPLLEKEPENTEILINLSDTHWDDGNADSALQHLQTILKLQPQRTNYYAKVGHILSSAGDINGALQQYQTALKQNSKCIPALSGIATTQRGKLDKQTIKTMQGLITANNTDNKLKPGNLAALHNGLAFYFDGIKQYKAAANHMQQANDFQWQHKKIRGWQYEPKKHEDFIDQLIQTFTPEYFERIKTDDDNNPTPVFIVAMPRSGTTLTEQILARHENILGIGERNFASQSLNQFTQVNGDVNLTLLNKITASDIKQIRLDYLNQLHSLAIQSNKPDITHIVDKIPDNYSLIGWILTLFPNAKIIHLQRNLNDVALSCWMTQFSSIRWSCHKKHLTHRIEQYQRIMQHWRDVIPDRFIETSYEQLVNSQKEESVRLIEYIGLDWDESCLKFYESDRLIRTASITQVRQPIHKQSVYRWKFYQPYITDLFDH